MTSPPWVQNTALIVVLAGWAATLIADMLNPLYEPPAMLSPLIMALAGYLFAAKKSPTEGDDKGDEDEGRPKGEVEKR